MNPIFEKLGSIRLYEEPAPPFRGNLRELINMDLPEELLTLLREIRGPVFFNKQALFKPLEPSGAEDPMGYNAAELLFGLCDGIFGIVEQNAPMDEFPGNLVAVGELPGGDLLCLDRNTMEVVRWDHEENEENSVTLIAHDFASFMASLRNEDEVAAEV